jgi:hypothetical protein
LDLVARAIANLSLLTFKLSAKDDAVSTVTGKPGDVLTP